MNFNPRSGFVEATELMSTLHQKLSFPLRILQWMWPHPLKIADLFTFTEETLNGKTSFFVQWYSVWSFKGRCAMCMLWNTQRHEHFRSDTKLSKLHKITTHLKHFAYITLPHRLPLLITLKILWNTITNIRLLCITKIYNMYLSLKCYIHTINSKTLREIFKMIQERFVHKNQV